MSGVGCCELAVRKLAGTGGVVQRSNEHRLGAAGWSLETTKEHRPKCRGVWSGGNEEACVATMRRSRVPGSDESES